MDSTFNRRHLLKLGLGLMALPLYGLDSRTILEPEILYFSEQSGGIPNSKLPLALYHSVIPQNTKDKAEYLESLYKANAWYPAWRWQIFDFHHFHSNTHEVIGCFAGNATLCIGGENGKMINIKSGDVAIIPAGVGHKQEYASSDFMLVGGYPLGFSPDTCYDDITKLDKARQKIASIPIPTKDPILSDSGIIKIWR